MENYEQEEKTISIGTLLKYLWKNIILFIAVSVGVLVIGLVYSFAIIKPTYKSTAMFTATVADSNGNIDYVNSFRIIPTAADLVTGDIVLTPVAESYGISKNSLSNMVSAKYAGLNLNVTVVVEHTDKAMSKELADAVVKQLIEVTSSVEGLQFLDGKITQVSFAEEGEYASPNRLMCVAVSLVAGVVVACVVIAIKELCSTKFRSRKEIENMLSAKVLGYFPDGCYGEKKGKNKSKEAVGSVKAKLLKRDIKTYEPYNYLLGNIKYSDLENSNKVIMFTSSRDSELKSTTAVNLAACMAYNGQKVIIVDMDMRKPVIHKAFGVSGSNGLVDYLAGNCTYEELIKTSSEYGVDIITAGKNIINPMAVIGHKDLPKLLNKLKSQYDYVIIDTSPVLLCSDATSIAPLCDGVIFNVAMTDIRKKEAENAVNSLRNCGANIIGINVTKGTESKIEGNSYYYGKEYYTSEPVAEAAASDDAANTND
ncbi:MAG: polysaccharide biosynthesis tyrosine autokinase [Candidatus Coproplasma sp.]